MNPELPSPQMSPEQQAGANHFGEVPRSPEIANGMTHEKESQPSHVEQQSTQQAQPQMPAIPMPVTLPTIPQQQATDNTNPSIAADDDLIEKEWVDKAKKIIADTHNDPFRREQEISRLQADYLRKRYGKELGTPN